MKSTTRDRPGTAGMLELHVFHVPEELWNTKLNTVSIQSISKFISVGFIRVFPDLSLQALRQQIGDLLGDESINGKFVYLKCVGRGLAVVKAKQELELKVKSFAPPHAPQPELYLLTGVDEVVRIESAHTLTPDSTRTLTPDGQRFPGEYLGSFVPDQMLGEANPEVNETSRQCKPNSFSEKVHDTMSPDFNSIYEPHGRPTSTNPEENDVSRDFKDSFSQEVHNGRHANLNNPFTWEDKERNRNEPRSTPIKNKIQENKITENNEFKEDCRLPGKKETAPLADIKTVVNSVSKENRIQSNSTWDSGVPESLDDRDLDYLENERKKSQRLNLEQEAGNVRKIVSQMQGDVTEVQYAPVRKAYCLPTPPDQLVLIAQRQQTQSFPTDGDQLDAQIKAVRQERKHLEKSREELVKRARRLLSQNQLRRNQARDSWKKKYFECKKATAPLEEMSNTLRHELETHYMKLVRQLEARNARKPPRNVTNTGSSKNSLIIQIATLKHEIDQLYRRVENAKIKLMTEIKLRNQAATELRALRAELVQKKAQSSQTRLRSGSVPQSLNRLATK